MLISPCSHIDNHNYNDDFGRKTNNDKVGVMMLIPSLSKYKVGQITMYRLTNCAVWATNPTQQSSRNKWRYFGAVGSPKFKRACLSWDLGNLSERWEDREFDEISWEYFRMFELPSNKNPASQVNNICFNVHLFALLMPHWYWLRWQEK